MSRDGFKAEAQRQNASRMPSPIKALISLEQTFCLRSLCVLSTYTHNYLVTTQIVGCFWPGDQAETTPYPVDKSTD